MKVITLLFVFSIINISAWAQLDQKDPYNSRVISKYYTNEELASIEQNHYDKFKQIKYTLLYSFTIDEVSLENCPNFNPDLFDVSEYEKKRASDRALVIETECGIRVTLLSKKVLEEMIQQDSPFIIEHSTKK